MAYFFREDPALGQRFFGLYPPWSALVWGLTWSPSSPNAVRIAAGVGVMVIAAMFGVTAYVTALRQFSRNRHTHGSARWASLKDIRRSGLFGTPGDSVYVGAFKDRLGRIRYLQHSGPEHILTYAPTRSGKSIGPVSMTLCSWSESAFVLDLKGELVQTSSGWRKRYAGNKVLIYEPAHPESIAWNPLDEIDVSKPSAVGDAQNLATLIVDPEGRGLPDHWTKTAMALLTGMILYVLHRQQQGGAPASLASIDAELANPERPIHDLWTEMAA
jgi:type IV secretion system protein VirD4